LSDIQNRLLSLLTPRSIIIGHSLNSDLSALKITHPFIIDTSLLFPHPRGPPLKSSLKYLAQKYIGREIQKNSGSTGHDSVEDARACLDLVKQKCEKGPRWGTSEATSESIFKRLARSDRPGTSREVGSHRNGAIVDRAGAVRTFSGVADVCIRCENDNEVVEGVKKAIDGDEDGAMVPGGGVDFAWARLHELEALRGWSNDSEKGPVDADNAEAVVFQDPTAEALSATVTKTVQNIMSIYTTLPPCTLFIVYSGTGDRREMVKLQNMHRQFKKEYATKKWDELSVQWTDVEEQALGRACARARQGLGLIAVT
jgi:RNA exonuclease 1